jgi:hypothetical protein
MVFKVSVEKRMYATGIVIVNADNAEQAQEMVDDQIRKGVLQTTAVNWDPPYYEECSFTTTGDVE